MKIWEGISRISGIYGKGNKVERINSAKAVSSKKDVLSISSQAKDYQTAISALKKVPDIRLDKVLEIQEKYEAGQYNVNGKEVAESIIKSIIDRKV